MKKMLATVLALALLLTAGSAFAAQKVGVAMPTQSLQRWNQDGANMKAQLEAAGYEVDLQYANNDVATQVSQIENMILGGAEVLGLTTERFADEIAKSVDSAILTPETDPLFQPNLSIVPLQCFAYYVALMRGCAVDKPRNLAKSVTVE